MRAATAPRASVFFWSEGSLASLSKEAFAKTPLFSFPVVIVSFSPLKVLVFTLHKLFSKISCSETYTESRPSDTVTPERTNR